MQIKASSRTDEERHHAMHHKNSSITKEGESILKGLAMAFTDNGPEYYQELLRIFKELKSSDVWNTLQDHWNLYQKKH